MLELNKIHCTDVREGLKQLPDESINCCITSPPYWGLRDYQIEPQIWDATVDCEHEWETENFNLHSGRGDTKNTKFSTQENIPLTNFTKEEKKVILIG